MSDDMKRFIPEPPTESFADFKRRILTETGVLAYNRSVPFDAENPDNFRERGYGAIDDEKKVIEKIIRDAKPGFQGTVRFFVEVVTDTAS